MRFSVKQYSKSNKNHVENLQIWQPLSAEKQCKMNVPNFNTVIYCFLVEMTNLCAQEKDGAGWSAEAIEAFICFNYNGALSDQRRDLPNTVTLLSCSSPAPFLPGPTAKLSNF